MAARGISAYLLSSTFLKERLLLNHSITTFLIFDCRLKDDIRNRNQALRPLPGKLSKSKKVDLHLKYLQGTEFKRLTVVRDKVTELTRRKQ